MPESLILIHDKIFLVSQIKIEVVEDIKRNTMI